MISLRQAALLSGGMISLRQVALLEGDPIDGQDIVDALRRVAIGRSRMTNGSQVADGRLDGLTAKVLGDLGWAPGELLGLNNDELDVGVLHDRGLEEVPEVPYLPDAVTLTLDAVQVLLTVQLSEDMGNTWGQCQDKAAKCLELLRAGIG